MSDQSTEVTHAEVEMLATPLTTAEAKRLWDLVRERDRLAERCERAEAALARIADRHGFDTGRQTGEEVTESRINEIDAWLWNQSTAGREPEQTTEADADVAGQRLG